MFSGLGNWIFHGSIFWGLAFLVAKPRRGPNLRECESNDDQLSDDDEVSLELWKGEK